MTRKKNAKPPAFDQNSDATGTSLDPLEIGKVASSTFSSFSDSPTSWQPDVREKLSARVELPPRDSITVRLVPANLVERFEENQSELNAGIFFASLFAGSFLGIIVNWVTAENIVITKASIVAFVAFGLLLLLSLYFLIRSILKQNKIQKEIKSSNQFD